MYARMARGNSTESFECSCSYIRWKRRATNHRTSKRKEAREAARDYSAGSSVVVIAMIIRKRDWKKASSLKRMRQRPGRIQLQSRGSSAKTKGRLGEEM